MFFDDEVEVSEEVMDEEENFLEDGAGSLQEQLIAMEARSPNAAKRLRGSIGGGGMVSDEDDD